MYHYGAGTNVGNVRDNNEDSYVCDDDKHLWMVADGMGGLGFGEVASAITSYTVATLVREGHGINQAIEIAHKNIKSYAESDGLGTNMGTTIVLLLSHGSLYNVFWVGDSRAYLLDEQTMKQITVDHSLVQSLIDQGELTPEEAASDPRKNAVTRALGVQELETVRADSISERWKTGQKILLCSDGLTDCVTDKDIESLMREGGSDQEIVDRLIEAALEGGGKDNITVIVVSAPATAKAVDTDTHVPAGVTGDDTHVPQDETEDADGNEAEQAKLPQQLDLVDWRQEARGFRGSDQAPCDGLATDGSGSCSRVALTAVLAMNPSAQNEPEDIRQNFQADRVPDQLLLQRNFPDVAFTAGKRLQLGVYSRLEGAESQTSELSRRGFNPHIEKRLNEGSTLYAVVIGPLDEDSHRTVVRRLQEQQLSFFHTSPAGVERDS